MKAWASRRDADSRRAGLLRSGTGAPRGRLIICSYGSSRPEGARAEPLVDELRDWGMPVQRADGVVSPEHGFVITSVVCLTAAGAPAAGGFRMRHA
jgi:hypothetical protein